MDETGWNFCPAGGLESVRVWWDNPPVKLTADSKGRLTSAEAFPPGTTFNLTFEADGSRRLVEMVEKEVPIVRTRKVEGFTLVDAKLDRKAIRAAIRADRDSR